MVSSEEQRSEPGRAPMNWTGQSVGAAVRWPVSTASLRQVHEGQYGSVPVSSESRYSGMNDRSSTPLPPPDPLPLKSINAVEKGVSRPAPKDSGSEVSSSTST